MGTRHMLHAVAAAWVLSLGFDLFLHGGLLARLYLEPSPFLLGPQEAFRRIPLGYAAFLVLALCLFWLFQRLAVRGAMRGFRLGLAAGAVLWGAFSLGLYSMSTVSLPLLAGWWIGQALELGLAGAVMGALANGVPPRKLWGLVAGGVVTCVVATILLQSFGLAPPMKVVR